MVHSVFKNEAPETQPWHHYLCSRINATLTSKRPDYDSISITSGAEEMPPAKIRFSKILIF
jgi:hypothetical protein